APKSNPSRTTYVASMTATMTNQSSTTGHRTVSDFSTDQRQKKHSEHKVEPRETNQREQGCARVHRSACAVGRPQDAVDEPGLASQLRRHPPGCRGDVRKREGQHQCPEQRPAAVQ